MQNVFHQIACTISYPPCYDNSMFCVCFIAAVNTAPEDLSPEELALDPQSVSPEVAEFEDVPDIGTPEVEISEGGISDSSTLEEAAASAEHEVTAESLDENYVETDLGPPVAESPEAPAAVAAIPPDSTDSPVSEDIQTPPG